MTEDLLHLLDWLIQAGCTPVALESAGVYWRPVVNIVEGALDVILTNARDAKGDNACKTELIDAEWLADWLRHGLLKPSFIPSRPIWELRDLTRYRESLGREQTALAARIQKLMESANIKLGQVASAALGASGKVMLRVLAAGETDAEQMSHLAQGVRKRKQPQLQQALAGRFTHAPRWILAEETSADPFVAEAVKLLDTIPGVGEPVAQIIVAAIGVDMERFASANHLASWAGMCPGNNESAGKRKSGKTTKGSRCLRAALVQAAWAASHQKGTYLAAQYKRLVKRRGKKKALSAVSHSIPVIASHVVQTHTPYQELGGEYCERRNGDKQRKRLLRQLESLGLKVTVEEIKEAA